MVDLKSLEHTQKENMTYPNARKSSSRWER